LANLLVMMMMMMMELLEFGFSTNVEYH